MQGYLGYLVCGTFGDLMGLILCYDKTILVTK